MSEPFAGLLEGLSEGFQTGHGFREDIKTRRRRRELEDRLAFLREQEESRRVAEEGRQATTFSQSQEEYKRRQGLHREVTDVVSRPKRFGSLGGYLNEEAPGKGFKPPAQRTGAPLSAEAQRAQAVGRALGDFGNRDLSEDEALLVGSGEVPYSAIQPKRYYPTTREEYLENYDRTAGRFRNPSQRQNRVTRAQAAAMVAKLDADYSVRSRFGNTIQQHYLSPAQREQLISKIVAGTFTEADLPPQPGQAGGGGRLPPSQMFPGPSGRPQERGLTDFLRGDSTQPSSMIRGSAPAPAARPGPSADISSVLDGYVNRAGARAGGGEDDEVDPARVQRALRLYAQFPDIAIEDFEEDLIAEGYTEAEISAVLAQLQP